MRRYKFLDRNSVYSALNRLRAAFLAAKNGEEVDQIINGILTHDEKMKIGRRIQIAEMIKEGIIYRQIKKELKVGITTVLLVDRKLQHNPRCFDLIINRKNKVEKEYQKRAYEKIGGSKMVIKKKFYTGFKRKYVER